MACSTLEGQLVSGSGVSSRRWGWERPAVKREGGGSGWTHLFGLFSDSHTTCGCVLFTFAAWKPPPKHGGFKQPCHLFIYTCPVWEGLQGTTHLCSTQCRGLTRAGGLPRHHRAGRGVGAAPVGAGGWARPPLQEPLHGQLELPYNMAGGLCRDCPKRQEVTAAISHEPGPEMSRHPPYSNWSSCHRARFKRKEFRPHLSMEKVSANFETMFQKQHMDKKSIF